MYANYRTPKGTKAARRSFWIAGWIGVVAIGFINGSIHRVYGGVMTELAGHQVSSVTYVILLAPWVLFLQARHPLQKTDAAIIGALWALATATFEFLVGHYVLADSWAKLINAYNVLDGRLWGLVVLAIACSPALARQRWSGKTPKTGQARNNGG